LSANNQTSKIYYGRVFEPFTCCDPLFYVYDSRESLRWKIHTDYCQCGVCYRGGMGKCHEVIFPIYSYDKQIFDPIMSEGFIKKCFGGIKEIYSDADTFELLFPLNSTPEERLMLIGAVLMIDYRYYEDNGSSTRSQGGVQFDL
jgi:hypothetical protein